MGTSQQTDLVAFVRTDGPRLCLLLDTNAVAVQQIMKEAVKVSRWNDRVRQGTPGRPLRLAVSALAHAEVLLDLRQRLGGAFDDAKVRDGLQSKGIEIIAFEEGDAERLAGAWMGTTLTADGWRRAKAEQAWRWFHGGTPLPDKVPRCSATVDWWIAGAALRECTLVISNDDGPEWRMAGISRARRADYLAMLDALQTLE